MNDYENVMNEFDKIIGLDQIAAFHINDSKNPLGAAKDRHENFGKGYFRKRRSDAGYSGASRFEAIPKILETPYIKDREMQRNQHHLIKKKLPGLKSN